MTLGFLILPFLVWLIIGCTKFFVNCIRAKRLAFDLIGYGGFPSNHSAIVSSVCIFVGLNAGLESAAFGVAITLAFIVIMDAMSLRNQVGKQAQVINQLLVEQGRDPVLRERVGHRIEEVAAGIVLGGGIAVLWYIFLPEFTS